MEKQIESLCDQIIAECPKVKHIAISSIIHRRVFQNELKGKTTEINELLRALAGRRGWGFIDHAAIDPLAHVGYDGIHLNANGAELFARSLSTLINIHHSWGSYDE